MEERKEGVKGCGSEMLACVPGKYRRAGIGANASGGGRVLRAIMRNFFGYAVISAVLKRECFLICNSRKVAKTELYSVRKREGRREEG